MTRARILASAVLVAVLLPQAAYAGLFDDEEARARIEQLRRDQAAQADQIGKLRTALQAKQETAASAQLELANQLEALRQEVAKLRGQIEVLNYEIEQSRKRQKDFYVDLDNRVRKLETAPVREEVAATPPAPDPAAEAKAYETALNLFKAARYSEAIAAFDAFVRSHPLGTFAPGALYWKAQSHYQLRDCQKALEAFRKVVLIWPNDAKAPDALLGAASCEQELGDAKGARATLASLISRYPTSPAANTARDRLKPRKK